MAAGEVRRAVRARIVAGGVVGPADLADELRADGIEVAPDELRGHLRALGTVRVEGPDGPVLAIAVGRAGRMEACGPDPDRLLQLTVAVVALVFLVVGVVGWLLA